MKFFSQLLILFLFILLAYGLKTCYIDNKSNGKENADTLQLSENEVYVFKSFYPEGSLKMSGSIKDMKLDGCCTRYYKDGTIKNQLYYIDGVLQPRDKDIHPYFELNNDYLKIGVKRKIRILNLFPYEEFIFPENVRAEKLADDSEYDYTIVPLYGDSVSFSIDSKRLVIPSDKDYIPLKERDYIYLAKKYNVSLKEAKEIRFNAYKSSTLVLRNVPVHK